MALIARAAFQNDDGEDGGSTRTYTLPATIKESFRAYRDHWTQDAEPQRCQVLSSGVIGGKTGYTSKAGKYPGDQVVEGRVRLIDRYYEKQIDSL